MEVKNKEYCTDADGLMSIIENLKYRVDKIEFFIEKTLKNLSAVQELMSQATTEIIGLKKIPHKCPVCEGNCIRPNILRGTENAILPVNLDCIVCEGKGIVWG